MNEWSTLKRLIWLHAILKSGGGTPTQTLTATGVSPLSLVNAVAHSILSLTQYGKCVQDGTPTPDAPVDIWCNNGKIVVSRNMCDMTEANVVVGKYINNSGVETSDTANFYYATYIPVTPGETYTMATSSSIWYFSVMQYDSSKNFLRRSIWGATNTPVGTKKTFDVGADCAYIRFGSNMRKANISLADVLAVNWMLTQSAEAVDYRPYGEQYVDGTPEVLTVRTNNLVDVAHLTPVNLAYSTNKLVTNAERYGYYIQVKPSTKYTISINRDKTDAYLNICETNLAPANNVTVVGYKAMDGTTASRTITTSEYANYLYVYTGYMSSGQDPFSQGDFQIEEGETATPYAPYHRETASVPDLFGVGDYADTQEIISGLLTHKVGVKVLDGTEDWGQNTTYNRFTTQVPDMVSASTTRSLPFWSTHFVTTYSATTEAGYIYNGANNTTVMITHDAADVATFKAWLAAQYAAGTPVIILYPLATETTEQTTPHSLHTVAGTNVVEVTAEVSGISLEVQYKGVSA